MRKYLRLLLLTSLLFGCTNEPQQAEVNSSDPALKDHFFTVVDGSSTRRLGGAEAKGVIYYFGGFNPAKPDPITFNAIPPYLISLNQRGWDVFRVNPPLDSLTVQGRDTVISQMVRFARDRSLGDYQKIAFVGQSYGGWNIIEAAQKAPLDRFISMAPACCATETREGLSEPDYNSVMLRVRQSSLRSKSDGGIFLFKDDPHYNDALIASLTQSSYPRVEIVNRPPGFIGHGSSWLPEFDQLFTACIDAFITNGSSLSNCP